MGNFAVFFFVVLKNSFRFTIRVSNSLDPDHFVGPDLGSNCLQKLSADDKYNLHVGISCELFTSGLHVHTRK